MASVKRAVRRLVRLSNGTMGIRYIDLDTGMEVLDLTRYQVLDPSQTTPEPLQNDNSDDEEVEINPPSGGSSGGPESRSDREGTSYISGSKNPAIKQYLSQFPPAPTATTTPTPQVGDDNAGGVSVTPDKDIADAEWADAEEGFAPGTGSSVPSDEVPEGFSPNIGVAPTGNVYDVSGSVMTGLDYERFDKGLQAWSSQTPTSPPGATEVSQLERDLAMRNELENIKDTSLAPPTGIYTAAQQNVDLGLTPDFSAVRPTGPEVGGMPAARQSTAQSIIDEATRTEDKKGNTGRAPQGGTMVAGRPASPLGVGSMPAALDTEDKRGDTGRISTRPTALDTEDKKGNTGRVSTPHSAPPVSAQQDAKFGMITALGQPGPKVSDLASVEMATSPSSARFGDEVSSALSTNQQIGIAGREASMLSKQHGLEMAPGVPTGGNFNAVRPDSPTVGFMPAAPNTEDAKTNTGRVGNFPSRMDVPGTAKPTKTAGMSNLFDTPTQEQSTAKSVVSEAKSVASKASQMTGEDIASMSPARAATMGLVERTTQEKAAIGKMIAGEMTPTQLSNLTSPNAAVRALARTELANIQTTVENRVAKYGTVEAVLDPSQYNSLMTSALPNGTVPMDATNANYSKYSSAIHQAQDDFYAGTLKPTDYGLTSYYSAYMDNPPSWSTSAFSRVGQHVFGTLPEYAPGSVFTNQRDAMVREGPRGWTPQVGGVDMSAGSMAAGRVADRSSVSGYSAEGGRAGIAGGGVGSRTASGSMSTSAGSRASGSGGLASYSGGTAGKAARSDASSSVSGASRSTAGKTSSGPSTSSGAISGASRSTAGKTGGSNYSGNNTSWGGTGEKV